LKSGDGINWSRYQVANGEEGRLSHKGIDTIRPCWSAAWLENVDMAYDPVGGDFYMTRSYPDRYYYRQGCSPATLPDRVQLYKAHGMNGIFNGPWQLLYDAGCEVGYPIDSATIAHDGRGNAQIGTNGSVTLMVNASGTSPGYGCPVTRDPVHRVVVGP
jgi:hypothetical protein